MRGAAPDWSATPVAQVLAELLARREGLLKHTGDLWQALV